MYTFMKSVYTSIRVFTKTRDKLEDYRVKLVNRLGFNLTLNEALDHLLRNIK